MNLLTFYINSIPILRCNHLVLTYPWVNGEDTLNDPSMHIGFGIAIAIRPEELP